MLADSVEIYRADCLEVIPTIGSVSHIISDPPYEQRCHDTPGTKRNDGSQARQKLSFAGINGIRDAFLTASKDICSGWALLFCTTDDVGTWRDGIEAAGWKYKTPCVWIKTDAMPKFNGQGPSYGHECIVTAWCGSGYSSWNGGGRRGVFTHQCNPSNRDGRHETEKPISLMLELVRLFTNPGDIIFDPFMGSAATGIACIKLGRKFIGIEKDEYYFSVAKDRLIDALSQPQLFVEGSERKAKQPFFNFKGD